MNEKIKDQDVLLVKEPGEDKVKVVAGMDENGKLKTVPPSKTHEQDFMRIDKHSNVLENFFTNFLRQYKDPTHFGFFKVSAAELDRNPMIVDDFSILDKNKVTPRSTPSHNKNRPQATNPSTPNASTGHSSNASVLPVKALKRAKRWMPCSTSANLPHLSPSP